MKSTNKASTLFPPVELLWMHHSLLHDRVVLYHENLRRDVHAADQYSPVEFAVFHLLLQYLIKPILLQRVPYLVEPHPVRLEELEYLFDRCVFGLVVCQALVVLLPLFYCFLFVSQDLPELRPKMPV